MSIQQWEHNLQVVWFYVSVFSKDTLKTTYAMLTASPHQFQLVNQLPKLVLASDDTSAAAFLKSTTLRLRAQLMQHRFLYFIKHHLVDIVDPLKAKAQTLSFTLEEALRDGLVTQKQKAKFVHDLQKALGDKATVTDVLDVHLAVWVHNLAKDLDPRAWYCVTYDTFAKVSVLLCEFKELLDGMISKQLAADQKEKKYLFGSASYEPDAYDGYELVVHGKYAGKLLY